MGAAVRAQRRLLHGGLPRLSGLPSVDAGRHLHDAQGGPDRCRVHAHDVGADGADLRHPGAPVGAYRADWPNGRRSRLHLAHP